MDTNTKSKKRSQNTICLRRKRLERSKLALSRHSTVPTVLENREDERKEKLTSLVGKIRYAQNRALNPSNNAQTSNRDDSQPLWEID
jgi:hypothetical protein